MPFTRSNADAGHSPSVAQDRRLRHPCRRFSKLDAAFELRHSKELASSCIIMQPISVHPAVHFDISYFQSRLLNAEPCKFIISKLFDFLRVYMNLDGGRYVKMQILNEKIRLAIIGCGGMADAHQRGFDKLADRLKVTGTADVILERAQKMAEALSAKKAVTDYRELLDDADAVLIVLPHHLHYEVGMKCLKAGKHVLMEKPMANSEEECLILIDTAKKENRVLMTAYPMRYHPLVVRTKELIDKKVYGDIFHMSIWTEQHTQYHPGHWALSAKTLGGGQLFSHGCHYIDLLLWFLGRPVKGIHLGTNYGTPWMEMEGTSNVAIEFESGPIGYHFGTWGAKGTRLGYSIHAHCTEGMIEAHITEGKLYAHSKGKVELLYECEHGKHTQNEMSHFLDCIQKGAYPLTDGPGSLQGLRVIWRMYEAERKNVVADLRGLGLDEPWEQPGLYRLP
jgi:predicted dehydrogenase